MDTKQETVNAVLAEMRRFSAFAAARSRMTPAPALAAEQDGHAAKLAEYADRIEAAAEREYEEAKVYFEKLHDGPSMICTAKNCAVRNIGLSLAAAPRKFDESAPGNAAAMRAALLKARNTLVLYSRDMKPRYQAEVGFMIDICDAALAAPARNCDRFEDADVARDAVKAAFANTMLLDDRQLRAVCDWLFEPAKGGAK